MSKINRVAEGFIRNLISAGTTYQNEIFEAVQKYNTDLAQVKRTAEQRYAVKEVVSDDYGVLLNAKKQQEEEKRVMDRYKADYINEKQANIAEQARQKIRSAQDGFQVTAHQTENALREQLEKSILEPINTGFLRLAQTMNEFGVAPSRLELDCLLTLSDGNLTAVRCIDSLLKKTNSGLSLSYKSPEEYSKDLDLIHDLGTDDYFCSPLNLHPQMCEIFKGQRVSRDDKSVTFKQNITFENTELMIRGRTFDSVMEKLENMIPSWGADIHYGAADTLSEQFEKEEQILAEIEKRETDLKDYQSPTSVNEDSNAIALAKELGKQTAKGNRPITKNPDFQDYVK